MYMPFDDYNSIETDMKDKKLTNHSTAYNIVNAFDGIR